MGREAEILCRFLEGLTCLWWLLAGEEFGAAEPLKMPGFCDFSPIFHVCEWPLSKGGGIGDGALVGRREQRGWRDSRCPVLQEGTMSPGPGQQQKEDPGAVPEPRLGLQSPPGAGRRPGKEGKSAHPILLSVSFQPHRPPPRAEFGVFCVFCVR